MYTVEGCSGKAGDTGKDGASLLRYQPFHRWLSADAFVVFLPMAFRSYPRCLPADGSLRVNGGNNCDSHKVELMVLVHDKGSGQPSLPSRRWLCADTSAVFPPADGCPRVNSGSSCDSLKVELIVLIHEKGSGQPAAMALR